ncbi:hypothetical protein DL93DRAFT_2064949 [Clavulina sp. PMI_390]|nr:hypothetical protein DL93DRAFT_2064949 [Clavulina sp. PMI_390]
MCFSGSNWKREEVPDHKFDFVDTRDYHTDGFGTRFQYLWLYIILLKSFAVYLSDLFTAITMLSTSQWSNGIFERCQQQGLTNCVVVNFTVGKWIFVGCIIFGYLLLFYEMHKAQKIIHSRDISYTFTNIMAQNYYSFRSYDHFCFFQQIENSTKKKDDFAFFIFFTFKGWKRLCLSDGPRQAINCLTLYSLWIVNQQSFSNIASYWSSQTMVTKTLLLSMTFTVTIFLGSLLILIVAAFCYIPLLCYIQGNLKEYCCHKVDKRISELLERKKRQRIQRQAKLAQKEARGDFSHLKNSKGELVRNPIPQPTLPTFDIDEFSPAPRGKLGAPTPSEYAGVPDLHGSAAEYPPPMPLYDSYTHGGNGNGGHAGGQYDDHYDQYYGHEYGQQQQHPQSQYPPHDEYVHGGSDYPVDSKAPSHAHSRSTGLAYDPTAVDPSSPQPHKRTPSGAWSQQRDEDAMLAAQAGEGRGYAEQWPGYGNDDQHRHQQGQGQHGYGYGNGGGGGGGGYAM